MSLSTASVTEYLANARVLNDEVAMINNKRDILYRPIMFKIVPRLLSVIR